MNDQLVALPGIRLAIREYPTPAEAEGRAASDSVGLSTSDSTSRATSNPAGPDILLIHGFGGTLLDWSAIAPLLTAGSRVVALDLRGNGASDDPANGSYSSELALDDIEGVITALGMTNPVMVGMSYGGWLATHWALRHPECPAIVSLDGIRSPLTAHENYVDIDSDELAEQRAGLQAVFDAQSAGLAAPVTAEFVDQLIEQRRSSGFPDPIAADGLHRTLVERDGQSFFRPMPDVLNAMRADLDEDLVPVFARIACPSLIFHATREMPGTETALMATYRRGVARDLEALARKRPDVRVVPLDATHAMAFEQPDTIAAEILRFIGPGAAVR